MSGFSAEELRRDLVKAENVLRAVYREFGPRGPKGHALPVAKYAAMTRKQVDQHYDFYHRHLMHRIAKVLDV